MRTYKKSDDNKNIRAATERMEEMVQRGWAYGRAVLTKCSEASRGKRRPVQAALAAAALLPAAFHEYAFGCARLQWRATRPADRGDDELFSKAAIQAANDPAQTV